MGKISQLFCNRFIHLPHLTYGPWISQSQLGWFKDLPKGIADQNPKRKDPSTIISLIIVTTDRNSTLRLRVKFPQSFKPTWEYRLLPE